MNPAPARAEDPAHDKELVDASPFDSHAVKAGWGGGVGGCLIARNPNCSRVRFGLLSSQKPAKSKLVRGRGGHRIAMFSKCTLAHGSLPSTVFLCSDLGE